MADALLNLLQVDVNDVPSASPEPIVAAGGDPMLRLLEQSAAKQPSGANKPPTGLPQFITGDPALAVSNLRFDDDTQQIVPLDIKSSSLGYFDYTRVAQQATPQKQFEVLSKMYPGRNVRLLDTDDIAIEVTDMEGRKKDVLINPRGIDNYDLIDLAVQAPELAAATAAAIALNPTSPLGKVKLAARAMQIVGSSLAGGATGAAKDVLLRETERLSTDGSEIAMRRTAEAMANVLFEGAGASLGRTFGLVSPFNKTKEPLVLNQDKAIDLLEREFGVNYRKLMTPGERTSSPLLLKLEAYESQQPGSSGVLNAIRKSKEDVFTMLQNTALGRKNSSVVLPNEEKVGIDTIKTLRSRITPVVEAVDQARAKLEETGQLVLKQQLDDITGVGPTDLKVGGEAIKAAREAAFNVAKGKADAAFAEVKKLPGGSEAILSGDAAAAAAKAIKAELPAVFKEVPIEVETASGFPLTKTKTVTGTRTEKELLKSGIPEGLMKSLQELESLKGGKLTLQTYQKMRQAAYDEIAKTEAVPGVKERWYNMVAKAYEDGLQGALDDLPDDQLKLALTKARDIYKQEVVPFEKTAVSALPKGPYEAGFLQPEQVLSRLVDGEAARGNWRTLKEVLGKDNPALKTAARAILDDEVLKSQDLLSGKINASALEQRLSDLQKSNPDLINDILGGKAKEVMLNLRSIATAAKTATLEKADIDYLLTADNPLASSLQYLQKVQVEKDNLYINGLLKDIGENKAIADKVSPMEFMNKLRNTDTDSRQVQQILSTLSREAPDTRKMLGTIELFRVFDEASKIVKGNKTLSASKLKDLIGEPGSVKRERFELLMDDTPLGKSGLLKKADMAQLLVDLMLPLETAFETYKGAGAIAGGFSIANITRAPREAVPNMAKKFGLAVLYTNPLVARGISNTLMTPERSAALSNALVASAPFITAAVEIFGTEGAVEVVNAFKASADDYVRKMAGQRELQSGALMGSEGQEPVFRPPMAEP